MIAPVVLFLLSFVPTAVLASPRVACAPQDPAPVQDELPDVAERLKELAAFVKKKGKEDPDAIVVIDGFVQDFEGLGPKDRASVVAGIGKCFKAKRAKELDPGVPDDRLYYAAATALGRMGPESVKPLLKLLGSKSHRKNIRLQARIADSLGMTEDERAIDPLVELLQDKDMELQAAGAQALAQFSGLELEQRKEIFKELLDILMGQKAKKDRNAGDLEAFERWSAISGPFVATMQRMSGHDEREAEAWQRWWNKNKKKDWDA